MRDAPLPSLGKKKKTCSWINSQYPWRFCRWATGLAAIGAQNRLPRCQRRPLTPIAELGRLEFPAESDTGPVHTPTLDTPSQKLSESLRDTKTGQRCFVINEIPPKNSTTCVMQISSSRNRFQKMGFVSNVCTLFCVGRLETKFHTTHPHTLSISFTHCSTLSRTHLSLSHTHPHSHTFSHTHITTHTPPPVLQHNLHTSLVVHKHDALHQCCPHSATPLPQLTHSRPCADRIAHIHPPHTPANRTGPIAACGAATSSHRAYRRVAMHITCCKLVHIGPKHRTLGTKGGVIRKTGNCP